MDSPKPIKYDKEPLLNDTDKKVIRVAAYTLGSALAGAILFFTGRHIYRKTVKNKEQNLSLDDNSQANFAKRLKMAFDNNGWWGTDVEAVRIVLNKSLTALYSSIVVIRLSCSKSFVKFLVDEYNQIFLVMSMFSFTVSLNPFLIEVVGVSIAELFNATTLLNSVASTVLENPLDIKAVSNSLPKNPSVPNFDKIELPYFLMSSFCNCFTKSPLLFNFKGN